VDAAHSEIDERLLLGLMATRSQHRQRMEAALVGNTREAGQIIRNVISQPLTISAQPDAWLAHPFSAPLFSLHPGTLKNAARGWLEAESDLPTDERVKVLKEVTEDEEGDTIRYCWQPVEKARYLTGAPLVVVHPSLASYHQDEGLILNQGGQYWDEAALQEDQTGTAKTPYLIRYKLESYQRHIELVCRQLKNQSWPRLQPAAARLEKRAGWPPGTLGRAAVLVALFHDVGKLTATGNGKRGWQAWAQAWQERLHGPTLQFYAHTDYDGSRDHQQIEREMGARPSHALEGAVAVAPILVQGLRAQPAVLKAAFSAIARHHGAFTERFSRYQLVGEAASAIQETLPLAGLGAGDLDLRSLRASDDPRLTPVRKFLVNPKHDDELLAYMLFARALRLADQAATAEGSR